MKYLIPGLIVLGLFLGQSVSAYTHENRVENLKEKRAEFQEQIDAKRIEFQDKITERKVQLNDRKQDLIRNHLGKIFERFSAAVVRLEKLSDRIQSRINNFEERGIDTTESQNLLDEANILISVLAEDIESAKNDISASLGEDISKESIREIIVELKDQLKVVHLALVSSIRSLKASGNTEDSDE